MFCVKWLCPIVPDVRVRDPLIWSSRERCANSRNRSPICFEIRESGDSLPVERSQRLRSARVLSQRLCSAPRSIFLPVVVFSRFRQFIFVRFLCMLLWLRVLTVFENHQFPQFSAVFPPISANFSASGLASEARRFH